MFTTPLATLKLVALNWAIPFWLVEALLIVIVLPPVVALAMVTAPVRLLRLVTAVDKHVPKLNTPEPSVFKHWLALPSAVGKVKARLLPVTPLCRVSVLLLVLLANTTLPVALLPTPRVRPPAPWIMPSPATVTVLPLSLMIESTMVCAPLNLAKKFVVPPVVVTPPPEPAQLPLVVQMLYVPALRAGKLSVVFATGLVKAKVVVLVPLSATIVLLLLPCSTKLWLVAPTVRVLVGVIVFNAVVAVISLLVPLIAALKLLRAPAAVVAPVPPWLTDSAVVNPEIEVISLFAPLAAAPKFVRAALAVVAPVPPLATVSGLPSVKPVKVGLLLVAIS